MREPRDRPALSREEFLALVGEWPRQITEWRAEIDQLRRGGTRPAAPCSNGTREPEPKRPGRQPSAGTCRDREAPPLEASTPPPGDGQVTGDAGPTCGGPLAETPVDVADVTERAARPRPQVTP